MAKTSAFPKRSFALHSVGVAFQMLGIEDVDGSTELSLPEMHREFFRVAKQGCWQLRDDAEVPQFDSSDPITIEKALELYCLV